MAFWGKKGDEDNKSDTPTPLDETGRFKVAPSASSSAFATSAATSSKEQFVEAQVRSGSDEPKVRSALGHGTVIQGKLSFDSTVSIDGKLSGEIYSSKTLVVGKSGNVDASIDVAALIVRGLVQGTIRASEKVELREGGQIIGDVTTPVMFMEEGCIFNGTCSMGTSTKKSNELKKEGSVSTASSTAAPTQH